MILQIKEVFDGDGGIKGVYWRDLNSSTIDTAIKRGEVEAGDVVRCDYEEIIIQDVHLSPAEVLEVRRIISSAKLAPIARISELDVSSYSEETLEKLRLLNIWDGCLKCRKEKNYIDGHCHQCDD